MSPDMSSTDFVARAAVSFFAVVLTGVPTELAPAPPAGYLWLLHNPIRLVNQSGSLALDYSITDSLGRIISGTSLAAGATVQSNPPGVIASGPIVCTLSGGGANALVLLQASLVPAANTKLGILVLTSSYQTVPDVAPPVGKIATAYGQGFSGGAIGLCVCCNGDTASATPTIRLTRGSNQIEIAGVAASAQRIQNQQMLVAFAAGDVVEAKLAGAPAIAGSVTLRYPTSLWDVA